MPTGNETYSPSTMSAERSLTTAKALSQHDVKSAKDMEKATSGFEALLLHEMLKSMWSTVETTGLLGEDSNEAGIYRDMLNQAIADNAAKGRGIGVREMLEKQLSKQLKPASDKNETT